MGGHEKGGLVTAMQVPEQNASPEDRVLEPPRTQWLYLWYPRSKPIADPRPQPASDPGGPVTSLKGCGGHTGSFALGKVRAEYLPRHWCSFCVYQESVEKVASDSHLQPRQPSLSLQAEDEGGWVDAGGRRPPAAPTGAAIWVARPGV